VDSVKIGFHLNIVKIIFTPFGLRIIEGAWREPDALEA
jgi:hypothetical protein